MASNASHQPQHTHSKGHSSHAPLATAEPSRALALATDSVDNAQELPFHPAEGKMLPVGATQKHLEHLAFGGLGAGPGLRGRAEMIS